MSFAHPWLLGVLLPAYLAWAGVALFLQLAEHRGRLRLTTSLRFSAAHRLLGQGAGLTQRLRQLTCASRLLTMALLCVALLRPQQSRPGARIWSQGVDIVLAVDTSGSMQALDLDADRPLAQRRTRLGVVKDVIADFVSRRPNDQVGMVVFGGEAFTQCPLTLDHDMVTTLLQRLQTGMAGDTTAIGTGLATAVNRLRRSAARSKVIILLTDGVNNAGSLTPKKAAELAKTFGIKIYTIGAANRGPAPFMQDSLFGKQVQYFKIDLDEPTLQEIAKITQGAYFRAEDSKSLARIYAQIDALEKTDMQRRIYVEHDERFAGYVILALLLLLSETVLLNTRLRKLP
jgi:Ca-activated chloride channel family protein